MCALLIRMRARELRSGPVDGRASAPLHHSVIACHRYMGFLDFTPPSGRGGVCARFYARVQFKDNFDCDSKKERRVEDETWRTIDFFSFHWRKVKEKENC